MSAVANFYLVPEAALETLMGNPPAPTPTEAQPPKPGFWKTLFGGSQPQAAMESPDDLFWDAFIEIGEELESFDYSGYAFLHLKMLLEERGIDWDEFKNPQLSARLGEKMGDTQAFDSSGAATLLQRLSGVALSRAELSQYADEEFGEDQGEMVAAMDSAFEKLKQWLAQVGPAKVGILRYG